MVYISLVLVTGSEYLASIIIMLCFSMRGKKQGLLKKNWPRVAGPTAYWVFKVIIQRGDMTYTNFKG